MSLDYWTTERQIPVEGHDVLGEGHDAQAWLHRWDQASVCLYLSRQKGEEGLNEGDPRDTTGRLTP